MSDLNEQGNRLIMLVSKPREHNGRRTDRKMDWQARFTAWMLVAWLALLVVWGWGL